MQRDSILAFMNMGGIESVDHVAYAICRHPQ